MGNPRVKIKALRLAASHLPPKQVRPFYCRFACAL